ncbi:uncharacterized protein LOC124461309 [Drosophila willistoni]|uniref:uncharacterized protein LOC124461309 n=1 Tax=Drosophila willistoni TaxID=7260 RepID=UPI001F076A75|nr:uncharacterized protein LOC124461309 [Drosophila willistoni]
MALSSAISTKSNHECQTTRPRTTRLSIGSFLKYHNQLLVQHQNYKETSQKRTTIFRIPFKKQFLILVKMQQRRMKLQIETNLRDDVLVKRIIGLDEVDNNMDTWELIKSRRGGLKKPKQFSAILRQAELESDWGLFTFKQVQLICENMIKESENDLCELYEALLISKLTEQYDCSGTDCVYR